MTAAPTEGAPPVDRDRALLPLDRRTCVALLRTAGVGRLVFTVRALPEVIPVNFRISEDSIVIRVADTSHAAGAADTVVAFQADEIDVATRTGWSVTVVGHTSEVLDPAERARIHALPLVAWAGGERDRFIRIPLDRVTGRRLVALGTKDPSTAVLGP
jgi:nitroimidazol reductase NimA-like FMN-containing flavoprotein (pyridoxamine 5'-phosphate oxidase superfamily)